MKPSISPRLCERSEAIHSSAQRKNGLLRRSAPRNDKEGAIRVARIEFFVQCEGASSRSVTDGCLHDTIVAWPQQSAKN